MELLAVGPEWLDPQNILDAVGLIGLLTIIFVETGLLVGFFLPGDSLLFVAGLFSATGVWDVHLATLLILCPFMAIIGDQCGYLIGRSAGPKVFNRPDSKLFKQEYVQRARDFFDHYGPATVIIARFVPIIRTFAPVLAGVGHMRYRTFLTFNIVGGFLWTWSLLILGYYLGQIEFIANNIEFIAIGIVALSVIPIYLHVFRQGRKASKASRTALAPGSGDKTTGRPSAER